MYVYMKEYLNASSYNELAVFECGKEECVKNKAIVLSKKNYDLFHYVLFGKGTLVINRKEYHLNKGDIFYIPANTDAIYFPDKEDPWVYEWVGFDGEKVKQYIEDLNLSADNPIIVDKNKTYRRYFNDINARYAHNGHIDMYAIGCLYQLFSDMLVEKHGYQPASKSSIAVQLAKDFIKNNYQFDITIEDVAKNANVTPNYLSSIFQKEENMTTKKYLTMVRMSNAMSLLQSGKVRIKEVSAMVGYPNQLHFSNEFKKYYGHSPKQFMKEKSDE